MKKIFTVFVILVLPLSVYSQTTTKTGKIKQLLELTGAGRLGKQVAENVISIFQKQYSDVDPKFWDEFIQGIKPEDLENLIVPIYDKYFTESDIDQMIAFYNTPIGKKVVATLPQITQESMAAGANWGREIGEKVVKRLKAKGYIEN